jgi:P pilus assembly chaperone PapD
MTANYKRALPNLFFFALSLTFILEKACAEDSDVKVINKNYIIKIGVSRVIYPEQSGGVTLSVMNPQPQPVLIATKFYAADRLSKGDYLATPPVFLLQSNQTGEIKFLRTNNTYPKDRESLNWVCVKSVPPKQDYTESKKTVKEVSLTVNRTAKICLQVRFRPNAIANQSKFKADSISWKKQGNTVIATNTTPYYITLKTISGINADLNEKNNLISPFANINFTSKKSTATAVNWQYVNDLGAVSEVLTSQLN